jgi:hypothetical protein
MPSGWITALLLALTLSLAASAHAGDVYVNGYTRQNGTVVQPYVRSAPDGIPSNNYSYPGNTNPYTGRVAPGSPSGYYPAAPAPLYHPPGYQPRTHY